MDNRIHPSRNRRTHQISPLQMSRRELLPKFVSGFARRDLVGAMALAGGGLAVAALTIPNVWDSIAPAGDRPIKRNLPKITTLLNGKRVAGSDSTSVVQAKGGSLRGKLG